MHFPTNYFVQHRLLFFKVFTLWSHLSIYFSATGLIGVNFTVFHEDQEDKQLRFSIHTCLSGRIFIYLPRTSISPVYSLHNKVEAKIY